MAAARTFLIAWLFCLAFLGGVLSAQDNYEIQVYGSELVKPGDTMLELHSNFTWEGSKTTSPQGMWPTNHALP